MTKSKWSVYELDFFEGLASSVQIDHLAPDERIVVHLTADKSASAHVMPGVELDETGMQCDCACLIDENGLSSNQPPGGEDGGRVE